MALHRTKIYVVTAGSAGSATGTAFSKEFVNGIILGVHYNAATNAPATSDLVVAEYNDPIPQTILSKANINTDQWFYPRLPLVNSVDGSVLSGPVDYIETNNQIAVTINQSDPNLTYRVTILWSDAL